MTIESQIALNAIDRAQQRDYEMLEAYRGFTNMIDDYFEYRCRSPQDQEFVHEALAMLTTRLREIMG